MSYDLRYAPVDAEGRVLSPRIPIARRHATALPRGRAIRRRSTRPSRGAWRGDCSGKRCGEFSGRGGCCPGRGCRSRTGGGCRGNRSCWCRARRSWRAGRLPSRAKAGRSRARATSARRCSKSLQALVEQAHPGPRCVLALQSEQAGGVDVGGLEEAGAVQRFGPADAAAHFGRE